MGRLFFVLFVLWEFSACGVPIETPELDERNEFVIKSPEEWGYRTFVGKNGLIGVLWPRGTSFNSTDTAIFVFLQTEGTKLPKKPENINLFTEKCQKATFMFSTEESKKKQKSDDGDDDDATLSIAEEYFSGRCGRTEVLFKEVIGKYTIVVLLASARYVSKKQLVDAKRVAANYRKEIEKYVKNSSVSDSDEEEEEDRAPQN